MTNLFLSRIISTELMDINTRPLWANYRCSGKNSEKNSLKMAVVHVNWFRLTYSSICVPLCTCYLEGHRITTKNITKNRRNCASGWREHDDKYRIQISSTISTRKKTITNSRSEFERRWWCFLSLTIFSRLSWLIHDQWQQTSGRGMSFEFPMTCKLMARYINSKEEKNTGSVSKPFGKNKQKIQTDSIFVQRTRKWHGKRKISHFVRKRLGKAKEGGVERIVCIELSPKIVKRSTFERVQNFYFVARTSIITIIIFSVSPRHLHFARTRKTNNVETNKE